MSTGLWHVLEAVTFLSNFSLTSTGLWQVLCVYLRVYAQTDQKTYTYTYIHIYIYIYTSAYFVLFCTSTCVYVCVYAECRFIPVCVCTDWREIVQSADAFSFFSSLRNCTDTEWERASERVKKKNCGLSAPFTIISPFFWGAAHTHRARASNNFFFCW